jgi:hypothetical protein
MQKCKIKGSNINAQLSYWQYLLTKASTVKGTEADTDTITGSINW